jgi:hypothetical protein
MSTAEDPTITDEFIDDILPPDDRRGSPGADMRAAPPIEPCLIYASEIEPEVVRWLWLHRFPRGKISIVEGDPGVGKSTLTLDIAARASTGRPFPGEDGTAHRDPENVILFVGEDGLADTVKPRLMAAGADCNRVAIMEGARFNGEEMRPITLPTDLAALRQAVELTGASIVVLDPLSAFIDGKTDSHVEQSVRQALTPLAKLAQELDLVVILVRHLVKARQGSALMAGGGSIAFAAVARAVHLAALDPEDAEGRRVIFAMTKSSLGPKPSSLAYVVDAQPNKGSLVEWRGESALSANELVAVQADAGERPKISEAVDWLKEFLIEQGGRAERRVVEAAAARAGIAWRTVERAAGEKLKVGHDRRGTGPNSVMTWVLPPTYLASWRVGESSPQPQETTGVKYSPSQLASPRPTWRVEEGRDIAIGSAEERLRVAEEERRMRESCPARPTA